MSAQLHVDDALFDGGPPLRVQRQLGLVRPPEHRLPQRAALSILIGWVPLAALTAAHFVVFRDETSKSFFTDIAAHARFLLAVPFLILAEGDCIGRMSHVARHFWEAGFVSDRDRPRYDKAVASTRRLLDSNAVEIIALLLAYALVALLFSVTQPRALPDWQGMGGSYVAKSSLAGWWHKLVSLPLLLVLILGWLWRVFLWWRFLWLMQRLELRL